MERFRVHAGDRISGLCIASQATDLVFSFRFVSDRGKKDQISGAFTTGSTRAVEAPFDDLSSVKEDGWLVGGSVAVSGTVPKRGQCYVVGWIATDLGGGPNVRQRICAGYLHGFVTVDVGVFVEPGPGGGEGFIRTITTANPAANAEIAQEPVPTNAMWRPLAFTVEMVQGITDTPRPALRILRASDTINFARIPMPADIAVSTTVRCTWARGGPETSNNVTAGEMTAVMPECLLVETDSFGTLTQGLGANSNYGVAELTVEEWLVL